ncbi:MAG TPA: class I adenylate-forming enzyme family protein [Acidimicrobiia bacterium]|nr:class I adenylate-forming enzyme family protein [Acidimicrobiia bacterium]
MKTIAAVVARNAAENPDGVAFIEAASGRTLTWREYDTRSAAIASTLAAAYEPGARVALHLPDGADIHVLMLACEKAGVVGVGIGSRAGSREVDHLVARSGASAVFTELPAQAAELGDKRGFGPNDLWFLNSTSGTTGLPKIVMHDQARWFAFHEFAQRVAHFNQSDVFASALPTPFGFGLWTAHFTPAIVGAPCVVFERFTPELAVTAIERYRVTILAAVSTQFVMMLNAPELADHDVSSLRILFTGGEMVPYEQARAFEDHTGAFVLQFYGSNETGALSCTTPADPPEKRLRTAGRVIPEMNVRLLDADEDGRGVPAAKGPAVCLGYWDDPAANAQLFTSDGWMRMGDLATIDADGYLTVVGRTSDIIIRGGKNISAAEVEAEVGTHPAVSVCAAVPIPDETFGERVCVFAELRPGATLGLEQLTHHLEARGTGKELWPERLVVVDELPRSSGGKVAKGALRDRER